MAERVLVVEDNPTTLKLLKITLANEGYDVITADDARTALRAAEDARPDLILQDLMLPDMDGLALVRELRRRPGTADVPILALSGMVSRLEDPQTIRAGFNGLLVKPIEPAHLVDAIRAYLPLAAVATPDLARGRRLLVVDDDPVQLKLARIHFRHLGFDVEGAESAAAALAAAHARRPDVVLSDVFMPEVDGFEFCLQVRRDPELASVPVVLISAQQVGEAERGMALRVGANAMLFRTPAFDGVPQALADACEKGPRAPMPDTVGALHAQHSSVIAAHLEQQLAATAGLARRCAFQAGQLSLLSGVADALTQNADIDSALREVLAGTLDAAGISKGALFWLEADGRPVPRHAIGFSDQECRGLETFFGHAVWLIDAIARGQAVTLPSADVPDDVARAILAGAGVRSAEIVPLVTGGRKAGAMMIGANRVDVTTADLIAFARTIGHQIAQSVGLSDMITRLAASEQRYRTLLQNATDAIAMLSLDGVIRNVNRRWEEITGLPEQQLIGRHIRDFAASGQEEQNPQVFEHALRTDGRTAPVAIRARDGSTAWIEFSLTHVSLGGESTVFTIGRDVTEQRHLEAQLRQAQKLEAVGQLAGGIAHDFNNVLTAILGFCGLLQEEIDSASSQYADLLEIQKAGERAAALTRQLLAFSRQQILQPRVVDINALVLETQQMLRRLLVENISVRLALDPSPGLIKIDPIRFEQVLVNLVVNARDAMPQGGTLTIETAVANPSVDTGAAQLAPADAGYMRLSVIDTGTGMDEATLRRIFEPFFTTKGVGRGTGLGLATVHGIVKQSRGEIRVVSEPGRGAAFHIYFPRVMERVAAATRDEMMEGVPRGTETVLLVEDDSGVRNLTSIALQRCGYTIVEAANPKDAIRAAAAHNGPIHLLLSDIVMPESAGPALAAQLSTGRPGLRVLYMSGYADETIADVGAIVQSASFLPKPFTREALARKVRQVLDAEPSAGSA